MMRVVGTTFLVAAFCLVPSVAFAAEEVSVSGLIEMAAELSGQEVTVEGELVGDYGFRDDGWMWTQLNDDLYVRHPIREGGLPLGANIGIGVRMPARLAKDLDPPGGYRHRGPLVSVTGTWKYHDPERQGESYLEVESLVVIEPGRKLGEEPAWSVILAGTLLVGVSALIWFVRLRD
jgi:hypothetical protein